MGLLWTHQPTGELHWVDPSERWIFSKIYFIDYGYFYDRDNTWYYVNPGPFRIKIPLEYIGNHLDDRYLDFDEMGRIRKLAMEYLLKEFVPADKELKGIAASYKEPYEKIVEEVLSAESPDHLLFDEYERFYEAMDDWVVIKTDSECEGGYRHHHEEGPGREPYRDDRLVNGGHLKDGLKMTDSLP